MDETPPPVEPAPPKSRWRELPPGYDPFAIGTNVQTPHANGLKPSDGGLPLWATVLIAATIAALVLGFLAVVVVPALFGGGDDAKNATAKEGARQLEFEIHAWPLGGGATGYPAKSDIADDGAVGVALVRDGMRWPDNPFTGEPMKQGTAEGDFAYEVAEDGSDFTLIVYLSDGEPYVLRGEAGS